MKRESKRSASQAIERALKALATEGPADRLKTTVNARRDLEYLSPRPKSHEPGKLSKFIELANLLPPGGLPDPDTLYPSHKPMLDELYIRFRERFASHPGADPEFEFAEPHQAPAESPGNLPTFVSYGRLVMAAMCIDFSYAVRAALQIVADIAAGSAGKSFHGWPLPPSPYSPPKISIGPTGQLRLRADPYTQGLLPLLETRDFRRIRRCQACEKFFWAIPRHKRACSQSCAGAARTRRWREKAHTYEDNRKRYRKQGFKAKERMLLNWSLRRAEKEMRQEK